MGSLGGLFQGQWHTIVHPTLASTTCTCVLIFYILSFADQTRRRLWKWWRRISAFTKWSHLLLLVSLPRRMWSSEQTLRPLWTLSSQGINIKIMSSLSSFHDSSWLCRLGAERFMGSSVELQELIMTEGSKMMIDASSDVRASGRHLWSELIQHSKTENMLKQYLSEVEMRNIKKTLNSIKER